MASSIGLAKIHNTTIWICARKGQARKTKKKSSGSVSTPSLLSGDRGKLEEAKVDELRRGRQSARQGGVRN
ncbi:hypothetical protein TNCT_203101 [Trichonephila clavata]|uniref:Uncharacterized protein n=1 Tax=Trichonephila clavata TaxID=2740835 RepID=A0A8X6G2B0_TRICU|nr:hypothetical protein TNCT_203101 [Trichonephila clavata]